MLIATGPKLRSVSLLTSSAFIAPKISTSRSVATARDQLRKKVADLEEQRTEMQAKIEATADLKPSVRAAALKQLEHFTENTGGLSHP